MTGSARHSSVALAFLALTLAGGGCTKTERTEPPRQSDAPVLTDDVMVRLLAAMADIKAIKAARLAAEAEADDSDQHYHTPTGLGMSTSIGDDAIVVVQRHGFVDPEEFERYLGYAQVALQQLAFGSTGGLAQPSKEHSMRASLQDYRERLAKVEADQSLPAHERTMLAAEYRRHIESIENGLTDDQDAADAMRQQFEALPAENLEVVKRHAEEFVKALTPHS